MRPCWGSRHAPIRHQRRTPSRVFERGLMEIDFSIGNIPAKLRRDPFFGGMKLITPTGSVWLQHPLQLSTHLTPDIDSSWERIISGHRIRVERTRPRLAAGFRRQSFRVFVDENLVAEANGY